MFKIYAVSQAGSMHDCNEDRAVINGTVLHSGDIEQFCDSSELTCAAVLDGVTGEKGGAVASSFAARRLAAQPSDVPEKAFEEINDDLISFAAERELPTMATTIACVHIIDDKAEVYFAGNSRVYALRCGFLQQISRDDTVAAATSKGDKVDTSTPITACMGGGDKSLFKLKKEVIEKPKMLLLTSDGIHDHIEDKDLEEIVLNSQPDEVCKLLIEKACKNGSWDDKTAVLVMLN